MRKFLFFVLPFILPFCLYAQDREGITITVVVDQIPELGVAIYPLGDKNPEMFNFDDNNKAVYIIEGVNAGYFTIQNGFKERMTMYAEKGDNLQLFYDGDSFENSLKIKGGRLPVLEYLEKVYLDHPSAEQTSLELEAFMEEVELVISRNMHLLDSCAASLSAASDIFIDLERNRIRYDALLALLYYPQNRKRLLELESYIPTDAYYDLLKKWQLEDPNLISLGEYRQFMKSSIAMIESRAGKFENEYQKLIKQLEYINREVKEPVIKNTLIHGLAFEYVEMNGVANASEIDKLYRSAITDQKLFSDYDALYKSWERIMPGNSAFPFSAEDINGKSYSLESFKGKNILLFLWMDIYPCVKQFPDLGKMIPTMDKSNLELVNLFVAENKDSWLANLENEDVAKVGTHLFLHNVKEFKKLYHHNSRGMFQFILIDKEGKILDSDFKEPSIEKIEKTFQ